MACGPNFTFLTTTCHHFPRGKSSLSIGVASFLRQPRPSFVSSAQPVWGSSERSVPPEAMGAVVVNSLKLFPKYWALSSEGGWADGAVITLFSLNWWSCWHLRLFLSKYNEVYYLPKFCSIWCLLQPRIFANEFLIKPGFSKINYIMFRTMSRKISWRRKAPSNDLIPYPTGRGCHLFRVSGNVPCFNALFHVQ